MRDLEKKGEKKDHIGKRKKKKRLRRELGKKKPVGEETL